MTNDMQMKVLREACALIGDDGPALAKILDSMERGQKDEEERINDILESIKTHNGRRAVIAATHCFDAADLLTNVAGTMAAVGAPEVAMRAMTETVSRVIRDTCTTVAALVATWDDEKPEDVFSTVTRAAELLKIIHPATESVVKSRLEHTDLVARAALLLDQHGDVMARVVRKMNR